MLVELLFAPRDTYFPIKKIGMRKGKRKEGKKGEKRGINKGKNYDLILKGEKTIYFPSICTVPTWGKKYHFGGGGGRI